MGLQARLCRPLRMRIAKPNVGSLSFYPTAANNFTGPSLDLDPDKHFFSVSDSKYYAQDEFNSIT